MMSNQLPSIFAREVRSYITKCMARNEQVAFLAYSRREVNAIEKILQVQFPGAKILNIVPDRTHNDTYMSAFIMKYWDEMKFAPSANILSTIFQEILARLEYLMRNAEKSRPRVQKKLIEWRNKAQPHVDMWLAQILNGQLTHDQMIENVKQEMLQFEIENNAQSQRINSSNNQLKKESMDQQNADFLLSTIHSAKGLEFQNVVVLYKAENDLDEEKKRMYYVAFTRAMNTEYILAYDTVLSPQIQADYLTVLNKLHAIAPAPNSPLNIVPKANRITI